MEEKKYSLDDILGMTAQKTMLEVFKQVGEVNQITALTASLGFFVQVLFLLEDNMRAKVLTILDEISVLMNGEVDAETFLVKLKDFDLKARLDELAV